MKKGKLLIISGFSGVGKGTVVKYIKENYKNYVVSVSATTRKPRQGEKDGKDYHFMDKTGFEQMIRNDELLEYAEYVGNYYGTPKDFVEKNIEAGNNVILEIETKGALAVKAKKKDAVMIFILPPDGDTLKKRLSGRKTESADVIQKRLKKASEETGNMDEYDYFIINDSVEKCAVDINDIINNNEPDLPGYGQVQKIKNDILKFSKGD